MKRSIPIALCLFFFLTHTNSMIMRNNALMSKMVSNFQDKTPAVSQEEQPHEPLNVVTMMKKVLCKNFPMIPCDVIMQDPSLQSLILMSIQQIKNKKLMIEDDQATTTHFPGINSEDLSTFLHVSHTGLFNQNKKNKVKNSKKSLKMKNVWSHERGNGAAAAVDGKLYGAAAADGKLYGAAAADGKLYGANGRKKVRKFYPHKIKYKDKKIDFSEEKQSNSIEVVERPNIIQKKRRRFSFRGYREASDPPVWRIDYMKHGEPSFNVFSLAGVAEGGDTLRTKLIKQVPNVIMDDNLVEQGERRDVMHPDVYIKKNIVRRKSGRENLLELS